MVRAQDWRARGPGFESCCSAGGNSLQNFSNSVYPHLPAQCLSEKEMLGTICGSAISMDLPAQSVDP